jgi:hypothetical protein
MSVMPHEMPAMFAQHYALGQEQQQIRQAQEQSRLEAMRDKLVQQAAAKGTPLDQIAMMPGGADYAAKVAGVKDVMSQIDRRGDQTRIGEQQAGISQQQADIAQDRLTFEQSQAQQKAQREAQKFQTTQAEQAEKKAIEARKRSLENIATYGPEGAVSLGLDVMPGHIQAVTSNPELFEKMRQQAGIGEYALDQIKGETQLRNRFEDLSKSFVATRDAQAKVLAAAKTGGRSGDLALTINVMKVLDPTSAVLDNERANVQNAANVPTQVRNWWNSLLSNKEGTLSDFQRQELVRMAQAQYQSKLDSHMKLEDRYIGLANEYGFKPTNVVFKDRLPENLKPKQAGSDNLPPGFVLD